MMGQLTARHSLVNKFRLELAPELWLAIFEYLPLSALPNIALASRSFLYLAQPLLFRSLSFCPYSLHKDNQRFIPRLEIIDCTKERIQFCSSPRIAHAVQECKIYPRYPVGAVHNTDIASNVLLDVLLDSLPLFVNLRSLSFMFVDFSQLQVLKLCALRTIGNLFFGHCAVEHVLPICSSKLKVSRLTIVCDSQPSAVESGHGLSIFSPHHLHDVSIINPAVASHFLKTLLGNATQNPLQLRTLTLPCELEVVHALCSLLHILPELTELKFCRLRPSINQYHIPCDENFSISTLCAPLKPLSKYQGPYQLFPHFVRPGALEHLNLWSSRSVTSDGCMDPIELHGALIGGRGLVSACDQEVLKTVHTLELSVTYINALVLDAVCARFPILRSLYVHVGMGIFVDASTQACNPETIMDALLAIPLPSTMRRLRLSSQATIPRGELATSYIEDCLAGYERNLSRKYPDLSFISLDEMDITLTWSGIKSKPIVV